MQQLNQLQIRLTCVDEKPATAPLEQKHPTLVWIEMSLAPEEEQFTMLCSSEQNNLYTNNTLAHFSSPLLYEQNLSEYEVAIKHIIFPPRMKEGPRLALLQIGRETLTFDMTEMTTNEQFIAEVKDKVKHSIWGPEVKFGIGRPNTRLAGIPFLHRKGWNEMRRGMPAPRIQIFANDVFIKVFGGGKNETLEENNFPPGTKLLFRSPPNIFLGKPTPMAILHCDLIKENILSNAHAQALQIVPVITGANYMRMYDVRELIYHPVADRPTTNISFTFKEPDGRVKNLVGEEVGDAIFVYLVFRRRH